MQKQLPLSLPGGIITLGFFLPTEKIKNPPMVVLISNQVLLKGSN